MDIDNELYINGSQLIQTFTDGRTSKQLMNDTIDILYYTIQVVIIFHVFNSLIVLKKYIKRMTRSYDIARVSRIMTFQVAICLAFMFFPPPTKYENIFTEEYRSRLLLHVFRFSYRAVILSLVLPYLPICIIVFCVKFLM
jgi:hypothetical protein